MSKDEKMIVNLPGPPKEMTYVVDHVLKDYLSQFKQDIIYTYDFLTMGIGESRVDEVLADLIDHQEEVSIALFAPIKTEIEKILKDYIIKEKNLKEALANIMPSYWTIYECDNFTLRDDFNLGHNHTEDTMNLLIDCREHPLGSIIKVTIDYQGRKDVFEIPLLKDPTLSYNKLESKIIERVYKFLTQPGYN